MPTRSATDPNVAVIAESLEGLPRYLSRREAADLLRCKPDHVTKLVRSGRLQACQQRIHRGVPMRIPLVSVRKYLEASLR